MVAIVNTSSTSKIQLASIAIGAALFLAACGASDSAGDAGSSDGESSGDVCARVQAVADASAQLDGAASLADGVVALRAMADALDGFAAVAPESVKADAERVAETTAILSEIDPETGPTEEQQAAADDPETDESAETIEDFARSECEIDLGS